MASPVVISEEEAEAVIMSGEALLQLASRLNGEDRSGAPFVTLEDGAGFMELLREVVAHHAAGLPDGGHARNERQERAVANEGRGTLAAHPQQSNLLALRRVVFELQPGLLATVLSILHAPHMMTDGDAVCCLFRGALHLLQTVVLACCTSPERFVQLRPDASASLEALELFETCTDLLHRLGAIDIVLELLYDHFPPTVRLAAAQLLFIMLLRDGGTASQAADSYTRDVLSSPEHLGILLTALTATDAYTNAAAMYASVGGVQKSGPGVQETWLSHRTAFNEVGGDAATAATLPELCLTVRLHIAACVRELANTHYAHFTGDEVLDVLLRISDTDFSGDLRALCIETMHVIVRSCSPLQWTAVRLKKELTTLCFTQLGRECYHDALRATLCLLEALILKDACSSSAGEAFCRDAGGDKHDQVSVCELLLALFADRALAALIGDAVALSGSSRRTKTSSGRRHTSKSRQPHQRDQICVSLQERQQGRAASTIAHETFFTGTTVACLSARCLRLLVQHAPYYRNGAFYLVQHLPSFSQLLEASVQMATFLDGGHQCDDALSRGGCERGRGGNAPTKGDGKGVDEASLMLAVELAILVGLCFAQDPRARQLVAAEFCRHHVEAQQTRSALISNLNLVSLSYFAAAHGSCDVEAIRDVTGRRLNTLGAVTWDTPDCPSRAAVHRLFTSQESRWNNEEMQHASSFPSLSTPDIRDARCFADAGNGLHGHANVAEADSPGMGVEERWKGEEEEVVPALPQASDMQRLRRLTFIVLSYAIHYTFKFSTTGVAAAALRGTTDDNLREGFAPAVAGREARVSKGSRYYDTYMLDASKRGSTREESKGPRTPVETSFLSSLQGDHPRRGRGRRTSSAEATGTGVVNDGVMSAPESPAAESTAEEALLLLRFHRGLRLFCDLAQFYTPHPTSLLSRTAVYQATEEKGMVRRQGRREAQRTISKILQEAENTTSPSQRPQLQHATRPRRGHAPNLGLLGINTRTWSIDELQEEDLFYFCIPYPQLATESLQYTRRRAVAHGQHLKKQFSITPQAAKARRWLLHDAIANIMPGVVHALSQFIQWFDTYNADAVKLPLLIYFVDDEARGGGGAESSHTGEHHKPPVHWRGEDAQLSGGAKQRGGGGSGRKGVAASSPASLPQPAEVALHAGNLIPMQQQIAFYFQRRDQWPPPEGRDAQSQEGSASVAAPTQGGMLDRACASPPPSVVQGDARGVVTPIGGFTSAGPLSPTARKSVLMRDIEREIERLQKLDICGMAGNLELAGASLLPDMAVSPYGDMFTPHIAGVMGGLGRRDDDDDDADVEEESDDFDELTAMKKVNHAWVTGHGDAEKTYDTTM
ncbi:casein kinase II, alpha chain [Trypanosoma rangeli]|uniref:Casein kinase II, alpha chain n=1 Tax=Trypanosoma rangeli TaxID=5698 RepID=A0A422NPD1_TRYRA|nr:casein kinase II, alpha chain [Trypanosoma rangeli]RNF07360.1 casein kinase II, alpha chain [Trypanosoma rangeli]|eukprot:RNF07360.1 casein kinase II, alpha chain [Trypanosoma rangeli]